MTIDRRTLLLTASAAVALPGLARASGMIDYVRAW